MVEIGCYLYGNPERIIPLPIPDRLMPQIRSSLHEYGEKLVKEDEDFSELRRWFTENHKSLRFLAQSMWEEIAHKQQYGLRRGGDRIALDFPALQNLHFFQYDSFVITPLTPYPKAQVRFLMRFLGNPVSTTFTFAPDHFSWDTNWEFASEGNQFLDELLYFIALESYWTIVVGRSESSDQKEALDDSEEIKAHRERLREGSWEVRPHFRPLPEGMHASEFATQEAEKIMGKTLPLGKTFVHGHEQGWSSAEDLRITFTYREGDLRNWVEQTQ